MKPYVKEANPGEVLAVVLQIDASDSENISSNQQLIILSDDELSEDDQASGNISGLLQSSQDVFQEQQHLNLALHSFVLEV